jgi:APA family basic amino acid/polyamine antiporter
VAVIAVTALNYRGVEKTANATRILVAIVLASLAVVVLAIWSGGSADPSRIWPLQEATPRGVLQSAGFIFFAFAGYARIATLGEEVIDPERTIPRAIPIALMITLIVYALVAMSIVAGAGIDALASSPAPLATAVEAGDHASLSLAVRIGASIASLAVLLSLVVGVSRTVFAMSANHDLPAFFAAVHPRHRVTHRAELAIGALVAAVVAIADIRSAIGFSSFTVLTYYAIANASAWTLDRRHRRWPRALAALGLVGCGTLAVMLPAASVIGGAALLALGGVVYTLRRKAPRIL